MFRDREDGAVQLAAVLQEFKSRHPLILAIPRGGVVTGAVLARELGGDLDVVLSRKLRAPDQPELAIGAISEDGQAHLNRRSVQALGVSDEYLEQEKQHQLSEIARRKRLFRSVRPEATIAGRTVIVTDDGIATGSTMMAALQTVRPQRPRELIVAVPVAPFDRLSAFEKCCDKVVCLHAPADFWAVGQFYDKFPTVEDEEVVDVLRSFVPVEKAEGNTVHGQRDHSTTATS
jgi:putative phosphoribosyl transferase